MTQHRKHFHETMECETIDVAIKMIDSAEERRELMGLCLKLSGKEVSDSMLEVAAAANCFVVQVSERAPKGEVTINDASYKILMGLVDAHDEAIMHLAAHTCKPETIEWDGPVPQGSYQLNHMGENVSTPEFLFLRKANELSLPEAALVGSELCGNYLSAGVPAYDLPKLADNYVILFDPRTNKTRLQNYLETIKDTSEGKRALEVLDYVAEQCATPIVSWLSLILTLPARYGGYGLSRPTQNTYLGEGNMRLPAPRGAHFCYDLLWGDKDVACVYAGPDKIKREDLGALKECGMRVVCVRDKDLSDPVRLEAKAQKIAKLIGESLPEKTDEWLSAHASVLDTLKAPLYPHMRSTVKDMMYHYF